MWKALMVILFLGGLVFPMSAHAQEFRVKTVLDIGGNKEAVIEDLQTGAAVQIREGEMVGEWKVIKITETLVTIERKIGPWEAERAQMPVRGNNVPAVELFP